MVLGFAGDYIAMGKSTEQKQEYLNGAVSAWNIAFLDKKERGQAIKRYMAEYSKMNPSHSKQDLHHVEEDLMKLIQQKEKLYPAIKVQIANAYIEHIKGKDHVTVMSLSLK